MNTFKAPVWILNAGGKKHLMSIYYMPDMFECYISFNGPRIIWSGSCYFFTTDKEKYKTQKITCQ